MATAKDYKVYGSGGKQRNRRLDDGLRAMQFQTDRQVNALQKLEAQNRLQSQAYISGLESKAKKEYEVGDCIGITLSDQIFVDKGNMASAIKTPPKLTNRFESRMFWLSKKN